MHEPEEPSVFATMLVGAIRFGESLGIARSDLVRASGLDSGQIQEPDGIVPYESLLQVWQLLVKRFPGDAIGLRYAAQTSCYRYGLVGHMCQRSATTAKAWERYLRYLSLIDPRLSVSHEQSERELKIELTHEPRVRAMAEPLEMMVGSLLVASRRMAPHLPAPLRVAFPHPRRHREHVYEDFFQCPVDFDASTATMIFPREALSLPIPESDPEVSLYLERYAQSLVAQTKECDRVGRNKNDFAQSVRELIEALLFEEKVPTEHGVAKRLHVSVRTLQRRLQACETSFRAELDGVRRRLSMELIHRHDMSLEHVALAVGFGDASALHRAFVRWTGQSPGMYRRNRT